MKISFLSCLLMKSSQFTRKRILLLFVLLFQISSFSCISGQCLNDQRSLLLQLNSTLTYDSSLSTKLVQWNQNIDCCDWNGVECDHFGHVIGLELDNETISGGIEKSSALYSFRYLENLNLAYNNFNYTPIPREVGNLTNLARLNLSYARFGGQIPVELSQITSLVMLDLSSDFYEGPFLGYPNLKNFVQNLTRLEELYLDNVDFTHKGDWWEALSLALPNLRSLSLRHCGLSGRLNSSFLQLQSLSVLRLDRNDLSGTVVEFFANFMNLTYLSLSNCSLQGVFPARIIQVPTLQHLDLSFNENLSGIIPEFPPGGSLRTLILGDTNFSGSLTDSIINLSNLSVIEIYDCSFVGPIPSTIGNLSKLVSLNFANNSFTGSIPIFSMSSKLEDIDLSYNSLNDSLSSMHFEGLSNLQYLDLSHNSLTGNIPTSLFRLPSLKWLELSYNKFSGQVNAFSMLNSSLGYLRLSNNRLEGLFPKSFFRLDKLRGLDLSFNLFNGTIQLQDFHTLQNLKSLRLSHNNLSVDISSVTLESSLFPQLGYLGLASCNLSMFPNLKNQINLEYLDLSNNKISGDIPSWIWEVVNGPSGYLNLSHNFLTNLQTPYQIPSSIYILDLHSNMLRGELPATRGLNGYVDYSSNHFQGQIPNDIARFHSYSEFFSVANNSLSGEIPISFCSAVDLKVLDFSGNLLSGELPHCMVQNLTNLGVLNIGRNNISGNIPDIFPVNCSLSTLDLSRNNLRGNIPPSLANCKSLQVMNVASNNLNGSFPCFLMNSSSLHVLLLHSNDFFDDIRCLGFKQSWPNLQIFDIAFNNFTGFLNPSFISSLAGMKLNNSSHSVKKPLRFDSDLWNNNYYEDKVIVTLKGLELEIVKIFTAMTSIDFSSNKFRGAIPDTFGELSSLHVLNLSHNSFTGTIPRSLGNLKNLESLDLSTNQLTGTIPTELTTLTFLDFFNVSYNKLVGMIPSGHQFLTFTAASYEGNTGLYGYPVNQNFDLRNKTIETSATSTCEHDVDWLFILAGLGYAVGVVLVVVPPLFSRRWGEMVDDLQFKLLKQVCSGYRG